MNQTKNLIQYRNLADEQKAGFDFENYDYEFQETAKVWRHNEGLSPHCDYVYRLKIEPDKWYYLEAENDHGIADYCFQGKTIIEEHELGFSDSKRYSVLRPAKPSEIPKPEKTLEDRIKAEYSDFDVVMLGFAPNFLKMLSGKGEELCHVMAQSMKRFAGYVFDDADGFERDERPIGPDYIHPVAVLFLRDESMAIDGDGEERRGGKIEMK